MDTGRNLKVHKALRRRTCHLLFVQFILHPISRVHSEMRIVILRLKAAKHENQNSKIFAH